MSIMNAFNVEKRHKLCLIFTLITPVSMLTVVTNALLSSLKDGKIIMKKVYVVARSQNKLMAYNQFKKYIKFNNLK